MPATLIITRPAFTDADSIPDTTFNGVTIISAIVPDATPGSEGVVRLAGDLTGGASAPQLAASGVTAGTYGATALKVTTFTVDAKGRLIAASERDLPLPDAAAATKGIVQLAGDLTGTAAAPVLVTSGVVARSYATSDQVLEIAADAAALAALVVNSGEVLRRIVRLTSTGEYFLAIALGSGADKWQLQTPTTTGLLTLCQLTVDAKGRVTSALERTIIIPEAGAAINGLVRLAGDLTGTAAAPVLTATGAVAGTYGSGSSVPVFTIDAKGRITDATSAPVIPPAGLPSAWVQFDGNSTASHRVCAYARASNVITVTDAAHTWRVGDRVSCDFTTGGATDGLYTVEAVSANKWTFTLAGANTGGNVTLEVYPVRNIRNVHSVVKDRRFASASYWVNFTTALGNDTFLVNAMGDNFDGISIVTLNQSAGVRAQDTRGVSLRSVARSDGSASAPVNASVVIFGG